MTRATSEQRWSERATRAVVAHGSVHGGTAGLAEMIATTLRTQGIECDVRAADDVKDLSAYDLVILGGALYAFHWHARARRFALRHAAALREREVYFFSSGPLDRSATERDIPPVAEVVALMKNVGARGHVTFGGVLSPDVKGFPAEAMAKTVAGDYRDPDHVARWAEGVARSLRAPAVAKAPVVPLPQRWIPLLLTGLVAVTAQLGGIELVVRNQGWDRVPLSLLSHTPFGTFVIPGILLFSLVGVPASIAAQRIFSRDPFAPFAEAASGSLLTLWMLIEMALLRTASAMELFYLALGIVTIIDASVRMRPLLAEWSAAAREEKARKARATLAERTQHA